MHFPLAKRDIACLAVGNLIGAGLATATMAWGGLTNIPDGLGGLMGGTAALCSTILAWRGFDRWEDRKRREQQAEVAGRAIVAASELWAAMRLATSKEGWSDSSGESDHVEYLHGLLGRVENFRAARVQVEAFLSPQTNDALEQLYALRDRIWELLELVDSKCGRHGVIEAGTEGADELFEELQGTSMRSELDNRIEAAKRTLRQYVLYQPDVG